MPSVTPQIPPDSAAADAADNSADFVPKTISPQIIAGLRLSALIFWMLVLLPPLALTKLLKQYRWRDKIMQFGSRMLLLSVGARVQITGAMSEKRPLLLVTNHLSYLDVCILNACVNVKFTPKNDILKWPVFGTITKLSGAVTVDRRADKIQQTRAEMKKHLEKGEVICLFPEATTNDGLSLKPFKPAFFSLCQECYGEDDATLHVQPAAIIYRAISGLPIDTMQWPRLAWYGDMDLAPHLWQLLMLPRIDVELAFLPVMDSSKKSSRKKLAQQAEDAITTTIEASRQKLRSAPAPTPSTSFLPKRLRKGG